MTDEAFPFFLGAILALAAVESLSGLGLAAPVALLTVLGAVFVIGAIRWATGLIRRGSR